MIGLICLWSGTLESIPAGWQLCDGTNGTPDLRDNFVVGAGDTYAVDDTGGSTTHDHAFLSQNHVHNLAAGTDIFRQGGTDFLFQSTENPIPGTTDQTNHLPPYFSLAYIQQTA